MLSPSTATTTSVRFLFREPLILCEVPPEIRPATGSIGGGSANKENGCSKEYVLIMVVAAVIVNRRSRDRSRSRKCSSFVGLAVRKKKLSALVYPDIDL